MKNADEFYYSCTTTDKQMLAKFLIEDGFISENETPIKINDSINDIIFKENLKTLFEKRHLLTLEEQNFINNLANRFKYI